MKYKIILILFASIMFSCAKSEPNTAKTPEPVEIDSSRKISDEVQTAEISSQNVVNYKKVPIRGDMLSYGTSYGDPISDLSEFLTLYSDEELDQVYELHIGQNEIEKISGLDRLINLHSIVLNQNILTDISGLKSCPGLIGISLGRNPIEDITPVYSFENLIGLDIEFTNVVSLEGIENLQKLEYLGLAGSKVSDLTPLLQLPNLKELTIRLTPASEQGYYSSWAEKMRKVSPDITIYY